MSYREESGSVILTLSPDDYQRLQSVFRLAVRECEYVRDPRALAHIRSLWDRLQPAEARDGELIEFGEAPMQGLHFPRGARRPQSHDPEEFPMENKQVKHWSARIELPTNKTTIDIVGEDLNVVKENIQTLAKGQCRFENYGSTGTLLVFHPQVDGGKKAMGWINTFEVPDYLSNEALIERRSLQVA
jgi:hypothetical protein